MDEDGTVSPLKPALSRLRGIAPPSQRTRWFRWDRGNLALAPAFSTAICRRLAAWRGSGHILQSEVGDSHFILPFDWHESQFEGQAVNPGEHRTMDVC